MQNKDGIIRIAEIFVEEGRKNCTDKEHLEFYDENIVRLFNEIVDGGNLRKLKRFLSELETMCLETDMAIYKKIIMKIKSENINYVSILNSTDKDIQNTLKNNRIGGRKQYKSALFYVDLNFDNPDMFKVVEKLNDIMAQYENRHES